MTAGHLVTRLQLALHGDEDLDHFHHTREKLVTSLQLVDLVVETGLQLQNGAVEVGDLRLDQLLDGIVLDGDLLPLRLRHILEHRSSQLATRLHALRARGNSLPFEKLDHTAVETTLENDALVITVLAKTIDLGTVDGKGALVLLYAAAGEDANLDNRAGTARRQLQRGVTDIGCLLTEDRTEELFLRRHRAFALRCHLADKNIGRAHLGADIDNACLVEVFQSLFTDIRNVTGDLFLAELGITGHDFIFLDMDRGEDIVANDAVGDQDRVLEIVAVPGHERDEHVPAQRQFTVFSRRAVRQNVTLADNIADLDQRPLVDSGVLVRTLEFQQRVDINRGHVLGALLVGADHDAGGVHLIDHTGAAGDDGHTRVTGNPRFHAGADDRRFGTDQRHSLTLHVRSHQGAVGVVVLEERDQRRSHRNQLLWRDVHQLDVGRTGKTDLAGTADRDQLADKGTLCVEFGVGLGDGVPPLFHHRNVTHFIGNLAIDNLTIRRFDEAVAVDFGKCGQRVDQADVRAFRRLDRADPAVMGRVHVTHLKAGTLTRQTARPKRRYAALMGDLGQRVGLVHELRQLRRAEELTHRSSSRLGVDQVGRHDGVNLD